jgi:hypothetical protein
MSLKTYHLSSNLTVVLKYFVPLVWTVFFGALCIIFWMTDELMIGNLDLFIFRVGWTSFFIIGAILMVFTLMKLMRVESDGTFIYVTNYFKIYKYPISNVQKITIKNYSFFKLATIHFFEPGFFGKTIVFMQSRNRFDQGMNAFEDLKATVR